MTVLRAITGAVFAVCLATQAFGDFSQSPSGHVVLSVEGSIAAHNVGDELQLDMDMLRSLEWVEVETYTPYTDGAQVFSGPTLTALLEAVGASGDSLEAVALNDYTVSIPASDAEQHKVILAIEQNGKRMRVRDKGPIWIVYPQSEASAAEENHSRKMIWQLARIRVN